MAETSSLLKVLLKQRHLQGHRAFCREYDRVAGRIDPDLKGRHPSKAQFYRWLSSDLIGLPYADHCRVLEQMFPNWTAEQLLASHADNLAFVPEPEDTAINGDSGPASAVSAPSNVPTEVVTLYAHRAETPKDLWLDLLSGAREHIDPFRQRESLSPRGQPRSHRDHQGQGRQRCTYPCPAW